MNSDSVSVKKVRNAAGWSCNPRPPEGPAGPGFAKVQGPPPGLCRKAAADAVSHLHLPTNHLSVGMDLFGSTVADISMPRARVPSNRMREARPPVITVRFVSLMAGCK